MPVPFLANQVTGAQLIVQVAWGANVNAAYSTWTWTDITTDVRIADGINLKHGRGDEADFSQPAHCSMVLDNKTGAYSLGGQSPNWPFVQKNTPVRVMVDHDGNGLYTALFVGYADSWQPSWDQSAKNATVQLTASGILRRLAQHKAPVLSSLRRRLSRETNVVAYWPLEEGKLATGGTSAIAGHAEMGTFGTVDFAANTESFASTVQMPTLKNGGLVGSVPLYTFTPTTGQQFRCLLSFPENGTGMTADGIIARIHLAHSSLILFDVVYRPGGSLKVQGWRVVGRDYVLVLDSVTTSFAVDGLDVRLYVELKQNGTAVEYKYGVQFPGVPTGLLASGSVAASTLGYISNVTVGNGANLSGLSVGHVTVQNTITNIFDDAKELDAFQGESARDRFVRLSTENGIEYSVFGDSTPYTQVTDRMADQVPDPLMTLYAEAQEVDRGIIYDGVSHGGLTFQTRRSIESLPAQLTIDVAAGTLAGPLAPIDDDQNLLNRAVVTRRDGGTAVYEDVTGPLGTSAVGTYDSSLTIPVNSDAAAIQYAGWAVALGTVEGYRYPTIELDLGKANSLIGPMLTLTPGDRVDLVNVGDVATQHPDRTIRLLVQGFSQTITPFSWHVSLTCTPYDPWSIGRTTNTNGTPATGFLDESSIRLDTAGSKLNAAASVGATSLSVITTSGPRWTTDSSDFPFAIEVGGIPVTVTAISGTTTTQTFTVSGVTKALAANLPVELHSPVVVGL